MIDRVGREGGSRIDPPVRHAVLAAGRGEVGKTSAILHPDKEKGLLADGWAGN